MGANADVVRSHGLDGGLFQWFGAIPGHFGALSRYVEGAFEILLGP